MTLEEVEASLRDWFVTAGLVPQWPRRLTGRLQVSAPQILSSFDPSEVGGPKALYLFQRSSLQTLLMPGGDAFAVSFWGHGMNSYAWTIYHRRQGLRFLAQVHHGHVFGDPTTNAAALRRLVRLHDLALLAAPYCRGQDLVVAFSDMRGVQDVGLADPPSSPARPATSSRARGPAAEDLLREAALVAGAPAALLADRWMDRRREWLSAVDGVVADSGSAVWPLGARRFVQCAGWPEGLQLETASDEFVDESLSFNTRRQLQLQGWEAPRPPDLPNHWQRLDAPVDVDEAVDRLLGAAVLVAAPIDAGTSAESPPEPPAAEAASESAVFSSAPGTVTESGSARRGRSLLLVPFFKGTSEMVTLAAQQALSAMDGRPSALIDLFGVVPRAPGRRARLKTQVRRLEGSTEPQVVLGPPQDLEASDNVALLKFAAELVQARVALEAAGRDVLIVGPWALPRHWWLYSSVLHAVADTVVVFASVADDSVWPELAAFLGRRELHQWSDQKRLLVVAAEPDGRLRLEAIATEAGLDHVELAEPRDDSQTEHSVSAALRETWLVEER